MTTDVISRLAQELKDIKSEPLDDLHLEAQLRLIESLVTQHLNSALVSTLEHLARDLEALTNYRGFHRFSDGKEVGVSLCDIRGQDFRFFTDLIVTMKLGARVLYEEGLLSAQEWDQKHGNPID
ncbi:MAG: hypothetical protein R3D56_08315 [Paracoccaceae bacterium]